MKIIFIILFLTFFSNNSYAYKLYNCSVKQKTEIAICGHVAKCKDKNGNSITRPIIYNSIYNANYQLLITDNEVSIKRVKDDKVFKILKENTSRWSIYSNTENGWVIGKDGKSFHITSKGNFYFLSGLPFGNIYSGKCKKQ